MLISVIIPIYNVERELHTCIESVVNQTYENLEILLVDDGSTDACSSICDEFALKDSRIRVIHKSNGGRSAARNRGIEEARGDGLCFVDGDDWIDSGMLTKLVELMNQENAELSICRYREIYPDYIVEKDSEDILVFSNQEGLEFYIRRPEPYQAVNSVCCKLYKRELIGEIRFVENKYYEDIMFTTKIYGRCKRSVYYDKSFYNYIQNTATSITAVGINELTFRDEFPIVHEKAAYLAALGREDLEEFDRYVVYKKFFSQYLQLYKSKTPENRKWAKRLYQEMYKEKASVLKSVKQKTVKKIDVITLTLFYWNSFLCRFFVWVCQNMVLPVKNRIRR